MTIENPSLLIPAAAGLPAVLARRPWLAPGHNRAGALVTITGDLEASSILTIYQAVHMAAAGIRVAYCELAFQAEIGGFVRAIEKHHALDPGDRLRFLRSSLAIGNKQSVSRLIESLRVADRPRALIIDRLDLDLNGLDERDTRVSAGLNRIQAELSCTVIVLTSNGGHALSASADSSFTVTRRGRFITLTNIKTPDAEPPPPVVFEIANTAFGIVLARVDNPAPFLNEKENLS